MVENITKNFHCAQLVQIGWRVVHSISFSSPLPLHPFSSVHLYAFLTTANYVEINKYTPEDSLHLIKLLILEMNSFSMFSWVKKKRPFFSFLFFSLFSRLHSYVPLLFNLHQLINFSREHNHPQIKTARKLQHFVRISKGKKTSNSPSLVPMLSIEPSLHYLVQFIYII